MRFFDAIASLQLGKKKDIRQDELCTVWSEQADDGPEAVPLGEYPRPQMVRDNWRCLNGWWDYAITRGETQKKTRPLSCDGKILVPFSPETARSGVGRTVKPGDTLWYSRKFDGIHLAKGERALLHFGAVDERCVVWVNGIRAGRHRNGYLPFTFEITEALRQGTNEITVAVRDDSDEGTACRGKQSLNPGGMFYHAQSGIWQTVWLEKVPEMYIKEICVTPNLSEQTAEFELYLSENVESNVSIQLLPEGTSVAGVIHEARGKGAKLTLPVPNPHYWTPEDPHLYHYSLRAGRDEVRGYFAMRAFGVGADDEGRPRLTLNGEPYFFHGVLDQGYWPESLMTPPADEAFIYDIAQMKAAGFNMLRKHVKIEAARWYYHCDRLGMVVWQDMVNGGGPVRKVLETYLPTVFPQVGTVLKDHHYWLFAREDVLARKHFEKELLGMVRALRSYPCIGLWTIFNEGWGQFDAKRLTALVKEMDPTRPVDHASGWFDQGAGEVRSIHNYFRKLKVEKDARPCVISEYGGINCSVAGHVMSEEVYGYSKSNIGRFGKDVEAKIDEVRALERFGLSGAVYTQVSDIEEETNGLLTYDRKVIK